MINSSGPFMCIECDACGDTLEKFGRAEFWSMLADAKERGWKVEKTDKGFWEHTCADCQPKESLVERTKRMFGL